MYYESVGRTISQRVKNIIKAFQTRHPEANLSQDVIRDLSALVYGELQEFILAQS